VSGGVGRAPHQHAHGRGVRAGVRSVLTLRKPTTIIVIASLFYVLLLRFYSQNLA
jgi:hypothetical protein